MNRTPNTDTSAAFYTENGIPMPDGMENRRNCDTEGETPSSDESTDLRQMELEFTYRRRDRQLSL